MAPVKLDIVIPESHQVELNLPKELPAGPAEIIVLPGPPKAAEELEQTHREGESLADLFAGKVGLIDSGGHERLSEDGGEKLAAHLEAKRKMGHL